MDDRTLVSDWMDAFARLFGPPAVRTPLAPPTPDGPQDLATLTYPLVFDQKELVGSAGHVTHLPAVTAHLHALGYAWDADARIVTIPTPATLEAMVPLTAGPDLGFALEARAYTHTGPPQAAVLLRYLDGFLPVPFPDRGYVARRLAASAAPERNRDLHFLTGSTVHAMTVLALNTHLVPRSALTDLGALVRQALPEQVAGWASPDAIAPLTLQRFYHQDLQQYCHAVWWHCDTPADFTAVFAREDNLQKLHAALAVRLDETRAGKGTVPSGDMNDMAPLTPVVFDLKQPSAAPG